MSRWVTFYYDVFYKVSDIEVHSDKETALKHFNKNFKKYFEVNTDFKADTLPCSYGYPFRRYYAVSANAFKKQFGVSVDEALKIAKGE